MRTSLALAAIVCSTACGLPDDAEFRGAPPLPQQVTVPFPGVSTMSVRPIRDVDPPDSPTLPFYYSVTQGMASLVNSDALLPLSVARVMVQLPATTRMGLSRTWGPYAPGGSDPLTYRLVVTQLGDSVFAYTLSARGEPPASETEFLILLEGSVSQGDSAGSSKGRMTAFFDNRRKLFPTSCEQGRIDFDYDSLGDPALLDITFNQAGSQNPLNRRCKQEPPRSARFHAERSAAGDSSFVFDLRTNIHVTDPSRPMLETVLLLARWKQSGEGRVDGKIADGEVTSDLRNAGLSERLVSLTQCWDEEAGTAFQIATPEPLRILAKSGDPSLCVPKTQRMPSDDLL